MATKEETKRIRAAFGRLRRACPARGWSNDFERLHQMEQDDEKEHRAFRSSSLAGKRWGLSRADTARLFVVQHVLEHRVANKRPDPADLFHIRAVVFYAWALFQEHKQAIRKAFPLAESRAFLAELDYAELVA